MRLQKKKKKEVEKWIDNEALPLQEQISVVREAD